MPTLRHLVQTARVTREWVEGDLFPLCESLRSRAQAVCYNANKLSSLRNGGPCPRYILNEP